MSSLLSSRAVGGWAKLFLLSLLFVFALFACVGEDPGTGGTTGSDGGAESAGQQSSAKEITEFKVLGALGAITGTDIAVTVPAGSDLANLTPEIVHSGASINPPSGTAQNFTNPVVYTVTAADGSTKAYTARVSVAGNDSKEITKLTINGVDGAIAGSSISLTLPSGTAVTALTPTISITGKSVSPASGTPQNFTNPVTYTVTAADGSTKAYTVIVSVATPNSKDITAFSILGVSGTIAGTSITLTLPSGSSVTSLTPTVTITGASVSPASGTPQNFTSPVAYTVTAADGTTKVYTVTVSVAPSTAKDITSLTIQGVTGLIAGTSITLTLPAGSTVASLAPTITITGQSVSPASGVPQNFTNPVPYTVTAGDGSTQVYTVTVTVAPSTAKEITSFSILGVSGAINGTNISLTVPSGTNVSSLTPTIAITGSSVNPPSGVAQNFTNPVNYTVTAADNSTKVYTVTVSVAASSTKDITSFTINGVAGTINGTAISVTLPFGANKASLTPTIAITGVSVNPASGVAQNFTNPVTYTVTAADNSTKAYTATVTVTPPPSITCVDQALNNNAFYFLCTASAPTLTPGGTFTNAGERMSGFWRNGGCGANEKYHIGAASVFTQNGEKFMRYIWIEKAATGDVGVTVKGTWWLQSNGSGGLTRTELCRAGYINTQQTGVFQQNATHLRMNIGGAFQEGWEIQ